VNRPFLVLVPLAFLLFVSCSGTSTEFSRSGVYLGGSAVGAVSNFDRLPEGWPEAGDFSGGFGVRAGYRLLDQLALEVAYEGALNFHGEDVDVEMENVALQAKLYLLTGMAQPYVLGGFGYGSAEAEATALGVDIDEKSTIYRLGLGLEIYFLDVFPLFVEFDYTWPSGDIRELEYLSGHFGAMFRF